MSPFRPVRAHVAELRRARALPDADYVLNHIVNRIPLAGPRIRAYAALGVRFDDLAAANIALGVEMWHGAGLSLGRRSTIGQRCYIDARGGLRIDDDVSIGREVAVLTATHIVNDPEFGPRIEAVHVGSRAFVGIRALILPGIRVGEGAVIGAGAVVTTDVPAYTIVAGNPAKSIGERDAPMSYELDWRPSWY